MIIKSNVPKGRPLSLVDDLADIMKQKQALKAVEKNYKALIDKLKKKNKSVLSGNKNILYFKEVSRKTVDIELLSSEEQYVFERLKSKATVTNTSLSFDKIISK
jgi:hypothetical protein